MYTKKVIHQKHFSNFFKNDQTAEFSGRVSWPYLYFNLIFNDKIKIHINLDRDNITGKLNVDEMSYFICIIKIYWNIAYFNRKNITYLSKIYYLF